MDKHLQIIDRALVLGYHLTDGDLTIVDAYRNGETTVTPDETTEPYDRAEMEAAIIEIAEECAYQFSL
jgi:hypothetical protein